LLAFVCLAGLAATFLVALHTTAGADRDFLLYRRVSGLSSFSVRRAGERALQAIDVGSVLAALAVLLAIGILRRSYTRAAAGVLLVLASVATAELVKHGLPHVAHALRPDRPATWPSGHTTVAVSLGLALVLAAPPIWRPLAALLGAAYGAGVGLSVVVLGWHYPSDVVGAFFICGLWACVAAAALPSVERKPAVDLRGLVLALFAVAFGLLAAAAIAQTHPGAVAAARSSRSVVAVAVGIGLVSVALFAVYTPLVAERRE
jgi:membrane-associated phospholipid phosphatase